MRPSRIRGDGIPLLLPASGPVHVLIVGEAPGPRGADKSGYPFFGDAAGVHLYTALQQLGAMDLPAEVATLPWDGALFHERRFVPVAHGVALGNAFDRCPTDDGHAFRAPTRAELESPSNLQRLARDLEQLRVRGLRGIVTLGRVAARTIDVLLAQVDRAALATVALVHPSAQGLLSMAPNRGKGARMADLQAQWVEACMAGIIAAGFPGRVT